VAQQHCFTHAFPLPTLNQVVYRVEVKQEAQRFGDYFSNAELSELPPRLRAIVEDNKVTHTCTELGREGRAVHHNSYSRKLFTHAHTHTSVNDYQMHS
jgi:hypothetical protein